MQFNEAQIQAIQHNKGPCMVIAGPGSGKTTVLTHRVKYLIDRCGVKSADILVITFTKAAAEQMKLKFKGLSEGRSSAVTFGTFHAVFFTILKTAYNYSARCIITPQVQHEFVKDQMCRLELEYDDEKEAVAGVLSEISRVKGDAVNIDEYESMCVPPQSFRIIYRAYDSMLVRKHLIDFDDMIVQCRELLIQREDYRRAWQNRYKYILVDEFQDINKAQFDVVRILADGYRNLFVVGDDDQSIYGFRGSAPQIMLDFKKYYSEAVRIDMCINYRSTGNIVLASRAVAEENVHRYYKDIITYNTQGDSVSIYEFNTLNDEKTFLVSEIRRLIDAGIAADDIAVLSRTNVIGNMYMSRLKSEGIVCRDDSEVQDVYEHWISKDILTYIRIALGNRERMDFLRIINKPLRYIKRSYITQPADIDALKRVYNGNDQMSEQVNRLVSDINMIKNMSPFAAVNYIRKGVGYDEYIRNYIYEHKADKEELYNVLDELAHRASQYMSLSQWLDGITEYLEQCDTERRNNSVEGVHMLTMHSSKGLEYKIVIVMDVCEGIIPYNKAVLDSQIEEERRLFYVAMTRAKEKLYLLYPKQRYNKDTTSSRFIEEILTARYPLLRTDLHTP
ncbi:MAG: ATP-dependent helicase [Eubacteriales bacterium]|nr:ATP-dependent helicase [Eubacteriales bacterium]